MGVGVGVSVRVRVSGAGLEQSRDDGGRLLVVTPCDRLVQGGAAILVHHVRVGLVREQHLGGMGGNGRGWTRVYGGVRG